MPRKELSCSLVDRYVLMYSYMSYDHDVHDEDVGTPEHGLDAVVTD